MVFMETHTKRDNRACALYFRSPDKNPAVILNENFMVFLEQSGQLQ